jgi:zinc/manganese transport system substrate-binding protein
MGMVSTAVRWPGVGRWLAAAAISALAVATSGCGASAATGVGSRAGVISAVAAENTYASVLAQVGGRYVKVSAILDNPSTDPHTFEASPQVAQEVSAAGLIVQNGAGYDSWITKMEAASPNPRRKVIVAQRVLGLPATTPNPHLWYRPAAMPAVARVMAADLAALLPAHRAYFQARLAAFDRSLAPWQRAITAFRDAHPGVPAATTEPVADYLLAALGIRNLTPFRFQADVMNGVDPSPQDISLVENLLGQHKVRLFVYNQQVTDPLTAALRQRARAAGIPVVGVYETMPPGFTYQSWMLAETRAIARAVTARASTVRLG